VVLCTPNRKARWDPGNQRGRLCTTESSVSFARNFSAVTITEWFRNLIGIGHRDGSASYRQNETAPLGHPCQVALL